MSEYYVKEVLDIDWNKQKIIGVWPKKYAQQITRKIRSWVGKKVVLYGGGSLLGDAWVATLTSVEILPYEQNYAQVQVHLKGKNLPGYEKSGFSPFIGPWKIALLDKK
jgi:hypothetical protein